MKEEPGFEERGQARFIDEARLSGHDENARRICHNRLLAIFDSVVRDLDWKSADGQASSDRLGEELLGRLGSEEDNLGSSGDVTNTVRRVDDSAPNASDIADHTQELFGGDIRGEIRQPEGTVLVVRKLSDAGIANGVLATVVAGERGRLNGRDFKGLVRVGRSLNFCQSRHGSELAGLGWARSRARHRKTWWESRGELVNMVASLSSVHAHFLKRRSKGLWVQEVGDLLLRSLSQERRLRASECHLRSLSQGHGEGHGQDSTMTELWGTSQTELARASGREVKASILLMVATIESAAFDSSLLVSKRQGMLTRRRSWLDEAASMNPMGVEIRNNVKRGLREMGEHRKRSAVMARRETRRRTSRFSRRRRSSRRGRPRSSSEGLKNVSIDGVD